MRFVLRRLGFFALTLWAALTLNFLLPRLMPGNPAEAMVAKFHGELTPQSLKALEILFGVNTHASLASQYVSYLHQVVTLNFGISLTQYPATVSSVVGSAIWWTLGLVGLTTILAFVLGTGLGISIAKLCSRSERWRSILRIRKLGWGPGEAWTRNSVSVGDGLYKSTDGGENWTNVGLKDSEHIAKILVNPTDGDNVLVCATGHLWDDNDERGVYQTTDGGKSWNKVLAGANGSSGCAMIARSKQEPKTIYAAMWDFRRKGWTFRLRRAGQRFQIDRWRSHAGMRSARRTPKACRPSRMDASRSRFESKPNVVLREHDFAGLLCARRSKAGRIAVTN